MEEVNLKEGRHIAFDLDTGDWRRWGTESGGRDLFGGHKEVGACGEGGAGVASKTWSKPGTFWTKRVTGLYCGSVGSRYQLENADTQGDTCRTWGVGGFKVTAERKVISWKRERGQRGSTREAVLPVTLVVERNAETHAYRLCELQKASAIFFQDIS